MLLQLSIIRLKKDTTAISAIAKKVKLAEELFHMPPSSKLLLKILRIRRFYESKGIGERKQCLPDRTVRLGYESPFGKRICEKESFDQGFTSKDL